MDSLTFLFVAAVCFFFFFRQSAFLGCAFHGSCIPTTLHLGCCCLIPECYSGFFFFFFFINYIVTYPLSLFSGSEEDVSFFFFLVNPPPAVLLSAHNARMHNDMEAFLGVSFMTIFPFFFFYRDCHC